MLSCLFTRGRVVMENEFPIFGDKKDSSILFNKNVEPYEECD